MSHVLYRKISSRAREARDFILDIVFPLECLGCGQEGIWLCDRCFGLLEFKSYQYCFSCKQPTDYGEFCRSCRSESDLSGIWIAGDYDDKVLAGLIKNLKYRFARDLDDILGKFLAFFLRDLTIKNGLTFPGMNAGKPVAAKRYERRTPRTLRNLSAALVMPVPLHRKRLRWRGFNQAGLIAARLAEYIPITIVPDGLRRTIHSRPQTKLNETERRHNVRNCFNWSGGSLAGKNVIIVDDVATTGATLNECARELKNAGAREIWGLVAAKG